MLLFCQRKMKNSFLEQLLVFWYLIQFCFPEYTKLEKDEEEAKIFVLIRM